MYVEIAFGSVQVRVRDHDLGSKSKQAETFRSLWLSSESVGVGIDVDGVAGRSSRSRLCVLFTVRRVSGGPNKHILAPHRAIPIPLIPCIPPGVVGVGLILALLGTYGSHTSAGPLTDIAAA